MVSLFQLRNRWRWGCGGGVGREGLGGGGDHGIRSVLLMLKYDYHTTLVLVELTYDYDTALDQYYWC